MNMYMCAHIYIYKHVHEYTVACTITGGTINSESKR